MQVKRTATQIQIFMTHQEAIDLYIAQSEGTTNGPELTLIINKVEQLLNELLDIEAIG